MTKINKDYKVGTYLVKNNVLKETDQYVQYVANVLIRIFATIGKTLS